MAKYDESVKAILVRGRRKYSGCLQRPTMRLGLADLYTRDGEIMPEQRVVEGARTLHALFKEAFGTRRTR